MKLTFLGTKGEIEEESRTHKKHSSLLLESEGFKLLIDFGETYSQKDFEKLRPDACIITHAHDDHIAGLKNFPVEAPIYLHRGIRESRYYKKEDYQFEEERSYSPRRAFSIGPFRILAVPVLHSLYAPNVALFIEAEGKKLCYASDVLSISKEDRERYLAGCDFYVGDGSTLTRDLVRRKDDDPYGHSSVRKQLAWLRDAGVKNAIFTHFGKEAVLLGDEELEKRFSDWKEEFGLDSLQITKDGKSFEFLSKREFLPVRPSGEKRGPRKTWQEVASHFNKPFKIVDGFVKLTGGVVNWPEGTEGDFDILICTIPEKELFRRTEFRLGRAAPPGIAERLDIRQKEEVGVSPFTNYVVLGDLVFVPREKLEVVEMTAEADTEREAELSLKEDKIKPLRHFYPLKPLRGARPATKQTIGSLLELLTENLFPFYVSKKHDGARHHLHRDGKEVKIISDDGIDNTDKLPKLKERLLKVPHRSFVLDAEIELWKEGQHYPREAAAGAIHSGKEEGLIINVFDILYLDGKDLHKLPQEERLKILKAFPVDQEAEEVPKPGKLLNRVQHKLAKDKESLRKLIEYFSYLPGSEGVVIKRAVSPYPLTGEPGRTKCWWKFHKSIDAVVTVIRRNETKTKGVYVYDYGIEAKKRKGLLPHPTEQVKGKTVHLIGRTFMTNEFMNPGERFWVEAETVNLIENLDEGTWRFTFWVPTFLKKTERAEHSPEEIIRDAKSENIFQWKVIKDGETFYHPKEPLLKIKDIHTYDPRRVSDQVLQDDWRIVAAWFASLKEGKKLKYREEEVVWLASRILKELFRRGKVSFGYVK